MPLFECPCDECIYRGECPEASDTRRVCLCVPEMDTERTFDDRLREAAELMGVGDED